MKETCLLLSDKFFLIGLITSNYFSSYATQIIYCAFYGATSGGYMGLSPVIIIDLIGLDNFINVYGFQIAAMGLGRIIGPPLIGAIVQMLSSILMALFTFQVPFMMQVEVITMGFFLRVVPWFYLGFSSCWSHWWNIWKRPEILKRSQYIMGSQQQQ